MNGAAAEITARTYQSQRMQLSFVDWGNAKASSLLLLHGRRDHCRSWDTIATEFKRDWHVIAPDLRGHGDSQWASDGNYPMAGFIQDLAELIEQQKLAPVALIGHSLGANVALRYAGIYPGKVTKLVAIEGLNASPKSLVGKPERPFADSLAEWIERKSDISRRSPRRYPSLETACARMLEKHRTLSVEQAQHLTKHGLKHNDDGTWSWKFDNYLYCWPSAEMTGQQSRQLLNRIACPTLHIHGTESWISDPRSNDQFAQDSGRQTCDDIWRVTLGSSRSHEFGN